MIAIMNSLEKLYENPNFGVILIIIIVVLLILFFIFLAMAIKDAKKAKLAMTDKEPDVTVGEEQVKEQIVDGFNETAPTNPVEFTNEPKFEEVTFTAPIEEPVTNDFRMDNFEPTQQTNNQEEQKVNSFDYTNESIVPSIEASNEINNDFRLTEEPRVEFNTPVADTNVFDIPVSSEPVIEEPKITLEPIKENNFSVEKSVFDQPISFENDINNSNNNQDVNRVIEERMNNIEKISNDEPKIMKNHQFSSVFVEEQKPVEEVKEEAPLPKVNFNNLETQEKPIVDLPKMRDIPTPKVVEPKQPATDLDNLVNEAFKSE